MLLLQHVMQNLVQKAWFRLPRLAPSSHALCDPQKSEGRGRHFLASKSLHHFPINSFAQKFIESSSNN